MKRTKKTTAERYLEAYRKGSGVRAILRTAKMKALSFYDLWIFPDGSCAFVKGTEPRIARTEKEALEILERPE